MSIGDTAFVQACPADVQYKACTAYDLTLKSVGTASSGAATRLPVTVAYHRLGSNAIQPISLAILVNGTPAVSKTVTMGTQTQTQTYHVAASAGDTVTVQLKLTQTSGLKPPANGSTRLSASVSGTVPSAAPVSRSSGSAAGSSPPSSGSTHSPSSSSSSSSSSGGGGSTSSSTSSNSAQPSHTRTELAAAGGLGLLVLGSLGLAYHRHH